MKYKEILSETMKPIDGLAFYIKTTDVQSIGVLYDPSAVTPTKYYISKVRGTAIMVNHNEYFYPSQVLCQNGYGPLMYALMANEAYKQNKILVPSLERSYAAIELWKNFDKNPFVDIVTEPQYGIKSNGTIDYISAEHRDQIIAEKYKKMHDCLINAALQKISQRFRG